MANFANNKHPNKHRGTNVASNVVTNVVTKSDGDSLVPQMSEIFVSQTSFWLGLTGNTAKLLVSALPLAPNRHPVAGKVGQSARSLSVLIWTAFDIRGEDMRVPARHENLFAPRFFGTGKSKIRPSTSMIRCKTATGHVA
jgi:hypothetical protein